MSAHVFLFPSLIARADCPGPKKSGRTGRAPAKYLHLHYDAAFGLEESQSEPLKKAWDTENQKLCSPKKPSKRRFPRKPHFPSHYPSKHGNGEEASWGLTGREEGEAAQPTPPPPARRPFFRKHQPSPPRRHLTWSHLHVAPSAACRPSQDPRPELGPVKPNKYGLVTLNLGSPKCSVFLFISLETPQKHQRNTLASFGGRGAASDGPKKRKAPGPCPSRGRAASTSSTDFFGRSDQRTPQQDDMYDGPKRPKREFQVYGSLVWGNLISRDAHPRR